METTLVTTQRKCDTTLRERKKTATRRALYEAVVRLAIERGLDAVTVEQIADEANVSRRTFSNYFANKEEALLYGAQLRFEALLQAVRERPRDEPPWRALTEATRHNYAGADAIDPGWLVQLQSLRRHPSLAASQAYSTAMVERDLADEINSRLQTPDPMRARIMAAAFLATLRIVLHDWAQQGGPTTLADALAAGLASAGSAFD